MSVAARRTVTIVYSGDVEGEESIPADNNASSPGTITRELLAAGENTIAVPSGATAVTIIPPGDNNVIITLKGGSGSNSIGVKLHLTDPSSVALHSTQTSLILDNGGETSFYVRLFWS